MNHYIFFLTNCPNDVDVLQIIFTVLQIIRFIFLLTPIALIILIMVDIGKAVIASDTDKIQEKFRSSLKRIIACGCLFLVPSIMGVVIAFLGHLDFDYTNYVACANREDIQKIAIQNVEDLLATAQNSLKNEDLNKAESAINKISDDEIRNQYKEEVREIRILIVEKQKEEAEKNETSPGVDISGELIVNYPDEVIENLGAFIGSEAGWNKDGFLGQLMTGAVYLNNYNAVMGNKPITKNTMCQLFSYKKLYASFYCNYRFSTLANRGIDEAGKEQLRVVAKILLAKKFTIPKDIRYEAADYIIRNDGGQIWGRTYTGVASFPYVYYGCSKYDKPVDSVDMYGNKVSTNFDDYQAIADKLYNSYVK